MNKEEKKNQAEAEQTVEAEENQKKEAVDNPLQKDLDDLNDKYLRLMAEYDNFRKRTQKEKEGIYADAYAECLKNVLPILDNLEKAGDSDNIDAVRKGLELTVKAMTDALGKMGIEEIECKTFDPTLHNAVLHVEDETKGEGEIVAVFQKGYKKGDRVIRHAMVQVAN